MSDNPYLALIASLNSESPILASPEDPFTDLSLWTNAEFTFDMPPGMGIFDTDSGFGSSLTSSIPAPISGPSTTLPRQPQQHMSGFMDLPQEHRPLSFVEKTRQRNPAQGDASQHKPEAHDTFSTLLGSFSSTLQEPSLTTSIPTDATSVAPMSLAAARLLRQPVDLSKPIAGPSVQAPKVSSTSSPAAPALEPQSSRDFSSAPSVSQKERDATESVSAADSFSKDDPDYADKVAAEEDKRRRNTAASARFRQKKKLREQALEQTAMEQTSRAEALERRVKDLEMEVRWLRGLIVEKDSRLQDALQDQANKRMKFDIFH